MPRRLLCFVAKDRGIAPGQRFRLEQWEPYLRARHGIELDYAPFESKRLTEVLYAPKRYVEKGALVLRDFARRSGAVRLAREYDGAVVYREAANIGAAL